MSTPGSLLQNTFTYFLDIFCLDFIKSLSNGRTFRSHEERSSCYENWKTERTWISEKGSVFGASSTEMYKREHIDVDGRKPRRPWFCLSMNKMRQRERDYFSF